MAYPSKTVKIVLSGQRHAGEIWQSGFFLMGTDAVDQDSLLLVAQQVALAATDTDSVFNSLGILPNLGAATNFASTKAYLYVNGDPSHADFVAEVRQLTPVAGTGTGAFMPPQCALVTTLLTGAAGRRTRGRMYWPIDLGMSTTPQLPSTVVDRYCLAVETFLGKVTNRLTGSSVHVVSNAGSSSRAVTQIRCDSKVDTQRRRARQLIPAYTKTVNLVP